MAKAVYFFLLTIILFANFAPSILRSNAIVTWHDPQLPYRISHIISNQTGAGVPYQVNFTVHYGSGIDSATHVYLSNKSQTDFRDLRFYGSNGSLLSAWNESTVTGSYVQVWIKVLANLSATSETVYLYFGNSGYVAYWNATAVFQRVISSGVVLALPMNEGAGNCTDYSGNGNTGTVNGASWVTTGKYGNALSFDGNDWVQVLENASFVFGTDPFSIDVWVKTLAGYTRGATEDAITLSKNFGETGMAYAGWKVGWDKWEGFKFWATDGANENPNAKQNTDPAAGWYHLVGVRNATGVKLYVNNTAYSTALAAENVDSGAQPDDIYFGCAYTFQKAGYFTGLICGGRVFNYELSTDEVSDLYTYYPQCSSSNLGSLYLRSFVNPEPQNGAWGTLETNFIAGIEDSTSSIMVFGLIGAIALIIVLLLVWKR